MTPKPAARWPSSAIPVNQLSMTERAIAMKMQYYPGDAKDRAGLFEEVAKNPI